MQLGSSAVLKEKLKNNNGQSLIEYLILVALVGIATITTVKVLQKTININLAQVVNGLQGNSTTYKLQHQKIKKSHVKQKDFSDFMKGSINAFEKE
ncbi:MAG: hypothetical protein KDD50_06605, partial [Bdellovibrionales bacterium]|nr:hypothetical protein [Bdellovibrionales bacterium]